MRAMKRRAVVVAHADADGHVIGEQVRRNIARIGAFDVSVVVDADRTKDHRSWLKLDALHELNDADVVLFVDLMFAPASCGEEADALVRFANERPTKRFFVLDHHPLPLARLAGASNIRAIYRRDVIDCTFGPPEPMMIVAALCEKQDTRAWDICSRVDEVIALGMKRAAALGGPLPGAKLLSLLQHGQWTALKELGLEAADMHRLPRGRRSAHNPPSAVLRQLDNVANTFLSEDVRHQFKGKDMTYDFEAATNREPPAASTASRQPGDLEGIVTLLELAAIALTTTPESDFSLDDLLKEAKAIAGSDARLSDIDAKIVLDKASFLKKLGGKRYRLK